jgi:hypothetical protein
MAKRVQEIGVPVIQAPFRPPVVNSLIPLKGPGGTTISVHGANLAGWQAHVMVTGRTILEAEKLTAETFEITIPHDLPPGFHEIRVDISRLCRRVFFFEVEV